MLKLRRQPKSQKSAGDTMVEVLIALGVISFVLAGAFVASHTSTTTTQDTQEHSQALELVQAQIELLRAHHGIPVGYSCFDPTTGVPVLAANASRQCVASPTSVDYQLSVSQPNAEKTYTISATWDSLLGDKGRVTLYYRLA